MKILFDSVEEKESFIKGKCMDFIFLKMHELEPCDRSCEECCKKYDDYLLIESDYKEIVSTSTLEKYYKLKEDFGELYDKLCRDFEIADYEYANDKIRGTDFVLLSHGATEKEVRYQKLGKAGAYYDACSRLKELWNKYFSD